jgi:hypothetical protein
MSITGLYSFNANRTEATFTYFAVELSLSAGTDSGRAGE